MTALRPTLLAALLAGACTMSAHAAEVRYTLDPNHTEVVATWVHLGFSHPSAMFNDIEGTLDFDPKNPEKAKLEVKVPINSVHTASSGLNEHLQKADFFDTEKFPVATFKSTRVERAGSDDKLRVTGDLSMHGVTKPLTLDVTVTRVGEHPMAKTQAAGFTATATLKRSDWGLKTYVPMISDEVKLKITTEANASGGE